MPKSKITRYAVIVNDTHYLTALDDDGREIIPLYAKAEEANEAAERSDLDEWVVTPITLEI